MEAVSFMTSSEDNKMVNCSGVIWGLAQRVFV